MSVSAVENTTVPETKARSRIVAVLLTAIAPGSGHVYAGHTLRGLLLLAALLMPYVFMAAGTAFVPPSFMGVAAYAAGVAVLMIAIYLFGIFDAFRVARRPGVAARWFMVVAAVLAVWVAGFGATRAIKLTAPLMAWRTFTVPSTSMEPTLRLGEWFIADMRYYRSKELTRGDVVVYRLPNDPGTIFVKRVVAIAGDRVQFREGRAFVNGQAVREPYIRAGDPKAMLNNTEEFVVPAGHFFAGGDNRANSTDSRWNKHGFVPLQNLAGRATQVFMSEDEDRQGLWVGTPRDSEYWSN
jgi:signal peptidase I